MKNEYYQAIKKLQEEARERSNKKFDLFFKSFFTAAILTLIILVCFIFANGQAMSLILNSNLDKITQAELLLALFGGILFLIYNQLELIQNIWRTDEKK